MARVATFAALCSAIFGTSSAAALGSAEDYASGAVHAQIMAMKVVCICPLCTLQHTDTTEAQWDAEIAAGAMDSSRYPELGHTPCENGFAAAIPGDANNTFKCNNVSLLDVLEKVGTRV